MSQSEYISCGAEFEIQGKTVTCSMQKGHKGGHIHLGAESVEGLFYLPVTEYVNDPPKRPCGKIAVSMIPRLGMYRACVLPAGHVGECQPGGTCFTHGEYVGLQCPLCPWSGVRYSGMDPAPVPTEAYAEVVAERNALRRIVDIVSNFMIHNGIDPPLLDGDWHEAMVKMATFEQKLGIFFHEQTQLGVRRGSCGTTKTPLGWRCTRKINHEGPCAAEEDV